MKNLFLLMTLVSLTILISLGGCAGPQDKIIGTWMMVSGGEDIYFTFQKDNDLNVNNQIFVKYFITKDNEIVIGEEKPVPFLIKRNTLTIQQESHVMTLTRVKR